MFRYALGLLAGAVGVNTYIQKNNRKGHKKPVKTSETATEHQFTLTRHEKHYIKQLQDQQIKPVVVALYDKRDGTTYADMVIDHLDKKGLQIIMVASDEGFNHSIFDDRNIHTINGIYLPGGPNVPVHDDADPRKKFEGELTGLASSRDIPLLGICRGQQTIGHHHGYAVQDLEQYDSHYSYGHESQYEEIYATTGNPSLNNRVVVGKGSLLHRALQEKLKYPKKDEPIEFHTTCLHEQHVKHDPENNNLQVTVRGKYDGAVEGIEIKTGKYYTIGLQHHPEAVIESFEWMRREKIAQAQDELSEALMEPHFIDPEIYTGMAYSRAMTKRHAAFEKSSDEKAARAELGLFTSQTKKHFLGKQSEVQESRKPRL
jgi:gamma-glutamyl-gamma-aminobutyrate hydrolase PuuD